VQLVVHALSRDLATRLITPSDRRNGHAVDRTRVICVELLHHDCTMRRTTGALVHSALHDSPRAERRSVGTRAAMAASPLNAA